MAPIPPPPTTPVPPFGGACYAPPPDNPALDQIINSARVKNGAANLVPASVIKAVYFIEAGPYYASGSFTCKKNQFTTLGLWQTNDPEYRLVVPQKEQLPNDEGICQNTDCKLSRCNAVDAAEIFARALLSKIKLWDGNKDIPLGRIETIEDIMYAAGRYYGLFVPDTLTNKLVTHLPQHQLYPASHPYAGTISYPEFVCAKSGFCNTYKAYPDRQFLGSTYLNYSGRKTAVPFDFNSCNVTATNFTTHPLRPFPKEVQETDKQTVFCAMRPLPVGQARIDMRVEFSGQPVVDIFTVGNLTQDFTEFIAPLMSITNPKKPDFNLPFNDKAQRYLLDFLEGRAYYEPTPEPANPTVEESWDLFNRLGVFRKLAPKTYQDELKRAVIQRANKSFSSDDNPYGFEPASAEINNYTVGSWQGQTVTLNDFVNNWAPLPKDFSGNPNLYQIAHANWLTKDGGKWSALWPYVPMFTREDTKGEILVINSNSPPNPPPEFPGTGFIEENLTDGTKGETSHDVAHPHLARAYEVTTSLSYLLTPFEVHDSTQTPELADSWIPSQWGNNSTWLDPSYKRPPFTKYGVELGAHCDPNPELITLISSSGDFAYDDKFVTNVKRVDIGLTHEMINGPESVKGSASSQDTANCGAQYDCETCIFDYTDPLTGEDIYHLDDAGCFYYKQIRSNPNYLITYTPFLEQILTSLVGSPRAVFDLFKPAGLEKKPYEEYDWPGIGNPGEDPPEYDYTPTAYTPPHKKVVEEKGWAEAGVKKPEDSQSYFYRYLGNVQCAKERVMQVLQPFITGSSYKPYAYKCFPELAPVAGPPGILPTGPKWLQWPTKNHAPARTSQCFGAPGIHPHAGLDFVAEPDDGAPIYPGAVGTVVRVDYDTVNINGGFGYFVIIRHDNGYSTIYSHLYPDIRVHEGQPVGLDTQLGRQDTTGNSTGNHVHFGLAKGSALSDFYWSGSVEDPCAAMQNCSCSQ